MSARSGQELPRPRIAGGSSLVRRLACWPGHQRRKISGAIIIGAEESRISRRSAVKCLLLGAGCNLGASFFQRNIATVALSNVGPISTTHACKVRGFIDNEIDVFQGHFIRSRYSTAAVYGSNPARALERRSFGTSVLSACTAGLSYGQGVGCGHYRRFGWGRGKPAWMFPSHNSLCFMERGP